MKKALLAVALLASMGSAHAVEVGSAEFQWFGPIQSDVEQPSAGYFITEADGSALLTNTTGGSLNFSNDGTSTELTSSSGFGFKVMASNDKDANPTFDAALAAGDLKDVTYKVRVASIRTGAMANALQDQSGTHYFAANINNDEYGVGGETADPIGEGVVTSISMMKSSAAVAAGAADAKLGSLNTLDTRAEGATEWHVHTAVTITTEEV